MTKKEPSPAGAQPDEAQPAAGKQGETPSIALDGTALAEAADRMVKDALNRREQLLQQEKETQAEFMQLLRRKCSVGVAKELLLRSIAKRGDAVRAELNHQFNAMLRPAGVRPEMSSRNSVFGGMRYPNPFTDYATGEYLNMGDAVFLLGGVTGRTPGVGLTEMVGLDRPVGDLGAKTTLLDALCFLSGPQILQRVGDAFDAWARGRSEFASDSEAISIEAARAEIKALQAGLAAITDELIKVDKALAEMPSSPEFRQARDAARDRLCLLGLAG